MVVRTFRPSVAPVRRVNQFVVAAPDEIAWKPRGKTRLDEHTLVDESSRHEAKNGIGQYRRRDGIECPRVLSGSNIDEIDRIYTIEITVRNVVKKHLYSHLNAHALRSHL